ncbi:MAG: NAD(P)/FAD-dependent oxidoreductase, partial [Myxococcales bacterium]|nr:NAD(P)/FAD-dependent oxidoreductase [Myxococcales bacterium]
MIIGAGFAGLCMAIQLKKAGIDDFVILEAAAGVGGTWRDNTYPGCACDVPSHLYSYSFEPRADWSRKYGPQGEILDYIEHCADKYGVRPFLRLGVKVVAADYDEAAARWLVTAADGRRWRARFVVSALGSLRIPSIPTIPGAASFEG